jgi:hypothetical protein
VSTITTEVIQMVDGSLEIRREEAEDEEAWQARRAQLRKAVEKRATVLVHAIFQVRAL